MARQRKWAPWRDETRTWRYTVSVKLTGARALNPFIDAGDPLAQIREMRRADRRAMDAYRDAVARASFVDEHGKRQALLDGASPEEDTGSGSTQEGDRASRQTIKPPVPTVLKGKPYEKVLLEGTIVSESPKEVKQKIIRRIPRREFQGWDVIIRFATVAAPEKVHTVRRKV